MIDMQQLRIGSLFSGIGGLERGLEWATGGVVVWQAEWDPFCRRILQKHWPLALRYGDVRSIGIRTPRVHLLCGGFPCQPVSVAGTGLAQEDERWMWPAYRRAIDLLRPEFVFVENVPGSKPLPADGPSERSSVTWPRSGTMRCGIVSELPTPLTMRGAEPPTSASESSSWPTPTVCGNDNRKGASPTSGDGLSTAVKADAWPTPTASDRKGPTLGAQGQGSAPLSQVVKESLWPTLRAEERMQHNSADNGMALSAAVKEDLWPTPTASPYGSNQSASEGAQVRHLLSVLVRQDWATPTSSDGSGGPGTAGRQGGENLRTQVQGGLSPEWVETLMGFSQGWTEPPTDGPQDEDTLNTHGSPRVPEFVFPTDPRA